MESRFSDAREHKLLIHAALDKGQRGHLAFYKWKKRVELTDIDYPSQKMLAAVLHHLSTDTLSQQIREVVKFTWLKSQVLLDAGFRAQNALEGAGIPVAWIKGSAVLAHTSTNTAERPMEDVDLLIPAQYVSQAVHCLQAVGFHSSADFELLHQPDLLTHNSHAIAFKDANGAEVDLHWHAFKGKFEPQLEEALWSRTSQSQLHGNEITVLGLEDLLLQVFATNREGNDAYWVLDAIRIIEENTIDFKLLSKIAKQRRLWVTHYIAFSKIRRYRPTIIPFKLQLIPRFIDFTDTLSNYIFRNLLVSNLIEIFSLLKSPSITLNTIPSTSFKANSDVFSRTLELKSTETVISFTEDQSGFYRHPFATRNWYQAEATGIWSSDCYANVEFTVTTNANALKGTITYSVAGSKYAVLRRFCIFVNGSMVKSYVRFNVGKQQVSEFKVPVNNGSTPIRITMYVNSTIVPRRHLMSLDQRHLGIFLKTISIEESSN